MFAQGFLCPTQYSYGGQKKDLPSVTLVPPYNDYWKENLQKTSHNKPADTKSPAL
jgi:hypothetical protein